ncbi:hypothetical protein ACEWY4_013689 [Coilia grayii]|uniref:Uncharacterized protein n=1 Tax=Coilia grayii TaxID=363190 RepID=A0ABD1JX72_9TELE
MAKAVVEDRDPFCCSVCLDPLRDPVTIPCGHSYCMNCISGCWDQEGQKSEYSCPQCRETFSPRPVLKKSTVLAELVDKMKNSGFQTASPPLAPYAEPGDVECDFCSERKLKAVKSCLVCLVSLCQTHIEPHYNIPAMKKHKLVQVSTHLQQRICSQHDKLMEVFCRTDQKCICMLCIMDKHKGHDIVSAAAERKEREKELGKTKTEFLKRIKKREKELQELREAVASYQRSAQEAEEQSEKIFTELLETIEKRRSEVKELIRAQQKAAVRDAEHVLEKLEQEFTELRRGDAELEKLLLEEDHVHFLQRFQTLQSSVSKTSPSISVRPHMSFENLSESLSALKSEVEELCKQDMMKIYREGKCCAEEILTVASFVFLQFNTPVHLFISLVTSVGIDLPQEPKTREEFLKYSCKLTLDPNTAHRLISLSEGNRRATCGKELPYPYHPDRFISYSQVLGFCRRVYWEAELDRKNDSAVEIAIAYKSITSGDDSAECDFRDDKSWCLECKIGECIFWHEMKKTEISIIPTSRIGVYVDHRAGTLSFYNISDTMTLLHNVNTTFTEPIYPGFYVGPAASVKLCFEE